MAKFSVTQLVANLIKPRNQKYRFTLINMSRVFTSHTFPTYSALNDYNPIKIKLPCWKLNYLEDLS